MKQFIRFSFLATLLSANWFALSFFMPPALATRLPNDLKTSVVAHFPKCHIRLDGSLETNKGELFLPLVPNKPGSDKPGKVEILDRFPANELPDLVVFSNGWCYLRVIKKESIKTSLVPSSLPEKMRKQLFNCKFPTDLITPENYALTKSMKPLLGDVSIPLLNDPSPEKVAVAQRVPEKPKPISTTNGAVFVSSPSSGKITMLDGISLKKLTEFPTEGTPCGMACAEGKLYIADQGKSRILILDPKKRQFLGQIDLPPKSAPKGLAAVPNGQLLYVSESATGVIDVIETATGKVLLKTHVAAGPSRIAITPNGKTLAVLNVPAGQLTLISTLNQKVIGVVPVGAMPSAIAISKDSAYAYVSNRASNSITIVDIARKQSVGTMKTGAGPTGMTLSLDGNQLFVANAKDNTIGVFDLSTRKKTQEVKLPLDVDFPGCLILLPDGERILVSSESTEALGILNIAKLEFESQSAIGHTSDELLWLSLD